MMRQGLHLQSNSFKKCTLRYGALYLLVYLGFVSSAVCSDGAAKKPLVAVSQYVAFSSLTALQDGMKEALKEQGFIDGQTMRLEIKNALGDMSSNIAISRAFIEKKPDVYVAITSPSAQAAFSILLNEQARGRTLPKMVFTAVTNPDALGVQTELRRADRWVTGVTDRPRADKQLEVYAKLLGDKKRIGIVYNCGEINAVTMMEDFKKAAESKGFKVFAKSISKTTEIKSAALNLAGKVDAFYVSLDNTVVSALEVLIQVADQYKIPVLGSDVDHMKRGAAVAVGFDYREVGKKTGQYVARLLKGALPASLAISSPESVKTVYNKAKMKALGLPLVFGDK